MYIHTARCMSQASSTPEFQLDDILHDRSCYRLDGGFQIESLERTGPDPLHSHVNSPFAAEMPPKYLEEPNQEQQSTHHLTKKARNIFLLFASGNKKNMSKKKKLQVHSFTAQKRYSAVKPRSLQKIAWHKTNLLLGQPIA